MSAAVRVLLGLLVMLVALAPMGLHMAVIGPALAHAGYRGMAVLSLVGAVAWYTLWLRALPSFRGAA
jgi:hypothetical protein